MTSAILSPMRYLILVVTCVVGGCAYHAPDAPTPIAAVPVALTPASIQILSASRSDRSMDLTAIVHTSDGRFVPDVLVRFSTTAGSVTPELAVTGPDGRARSVATSPDTATMQVTAGELSASTTIGATLPVIATPSPSPIPQPTPSTPLAPLTVTILVTPRAVGSLTDFSLATQGMTQAQWTFGDGSDAVTTAPFTAHAYAAAGTFVAGVTVRDTAGRTATATHSVTIVAPAAPPPTTTQNPSLVLTVGCSAGNKSTVATFCNVSAKDETGATVTGTLSTVSWDFGDGSAVIANGSVLRSHQYNQPGTFTVSVTAVGAQGQRGAATTTATIAP